MIPWEHIDTLKDATTLACDVRDLDPNDIATQIQKWPREKVIATLIATAAMVDVDKPLHTLLRWSGQLRKPGPKPKPLAGYCRRGHERDPFNTRLDSNGTTLRCRVCERERRAELRQERRAA